MPAKQTESAPSLLQVYTQVCRDRMKHSFLLRGARGRGRHLLLNLKTPKFGEGRCKLWKDGLAQWSLLVADRISTGHFSKQYWSPPLTSTGHDADQYWLLFPPAVPLFSMHCIRGALYGAWRRRN